MAHPNLRERFTRDHLAITHASRAWVLLEDGFNGNAPTPFEEGMTVEEAAAMHLRLALDRLAMREARRRVGLPPEKSRNIQKQRLITSSEPEAVPA